MPNPSLRLRRRFCTFAVCAGLMFPSVAAYGDAGSYLASRQATMDNNFDQLAHFAQRALVAAPQDRPLLEAVISANIARGSFDAVTGNARALEALDAGNQLAAMVTLTQLSKAEDYAGVIAAIDGSTSVSPVVDQFSRAWALVGNGEISAALNAFDLATVEGQASEFFGPYNKALALAYVGDFEGAEAILASDATPDTRDALVARMQVLSQLERGDDALALYDEFFSAANDPNVDAMAAKLRAGESVPFTEVQSARDGISEVYYSIAVALAGGPNSAYTLLYARIAMELRPERAQTVLLVGDLLTSLDNHDLAEIVYDKLTADSPSYHLAELGRAQALRAVGKDAAALEVLKALSEAQPERGGVHVALGDAMRRGENYAGAIDAYTRALSLIEKPGRAQWPLYFTRGIAYERSKQWPEAEADFRKALELEPGQPSVLNYLGYSFLEKKTNLEEAMDMIREAADARPEDGYIIDSLAWGYFRLGRYDEALSPMVRAVELMPVDPIVNDHLGDVYWAVGREREARFQWKRALSFEPEEEDATRIRRKLEVGLDEVLREEGETPTRELAEVD